MTKRESSMLRILPHGHITVVGVPGGSTQRNLLNQEIWGWRGPVSCYLHEVQRDREHDPLSCTSSGVEMMASHNGARGYPEFSGSQKGCRWPSKNTQGPWVGNLGEASPWGPGTSPRKHTRSMQPTSRTADFWKDLAASPRTASVGDSFLDGNRTRGIWSRRSSGHWGKPRLRSRWSAPTPSPPCSTHPASVSDGTRLVGQPCPYWNKDYGEREKEKEILTVARL